MWALALTAGPRLEHLPTVCLWKRLTGFDCPGCGIGRALVAALGGHFSEALHYHRLVFVAVACLAWVSWTAVRSLSVEV